MKRAVVGGIGMVVAVRMVAGFHSVVAAEVEVSHNSVEIDYRAAVGILLEAVQMLDTAIQLLEAVELLDEMALEHRMQGMAVAGMTLGTEAAALDMMIVRMDET